LSCVKHTKSGLRSSLERESSANFVTLKTTTFKPRTEELRKSTEQQIADEGHKHNTGLPEHQDHRAELHIGRNLQTKMFTTPGTDRVAR